MFSFLRRKKTHTPEESADLAVQDQSLEEPVQPLETPSSVEVEPEIIPLEIIAQPLVENIPLDTSVQKEPLSQIETRNLEEMVATVAENNHGETKEIASVDRASEKQGFFTRLKKGLSKTRHSFTDNLASLVLGRKEIDDDLLEELEMILLTADVGIDATDRIINNLTEQVSRKALKEPKALITALKMQLQAILEPIATPLDVDKHLAKQEGPFVILMVGINGVGKTTTIGKLAKKYQEEGKSVMLAAGDTFRAAAVEQLQTWGARNNVPVIAQKTGADSAAVLFDAIQSAKAKKIDILIADTAGRLHTQSNLMEELKKVKRVMGKVDASAPHEVMLVIDAGTGQNALNQAQQFKEAVNVSGITLTKLDGTAKGGIVFALAEQTKIPIRFIGVGESIDDLRPFESQAFTEALFDQSS